MRTILREKKSRLSETQDLSKTTKKDKGSLPPLLLPPITSRWSSQQAQMAPCDLSDKVGNPWYDTQGLSQFDTSLTRSLCLGTSGQLLCVCQTIHISPSSSLHFPTPLRFLWGPPSTSSLGRPESQSSLEAVVALACCELFLKLSFKFKRVFFCISICFAYTKTVTLASLASPAEDLHSASL